MLLHPLLQVDQGEIGGWVGSGGAGRDRGGGSGGLGASF